MRQRDILFLMCNIFTAPHVPAWLGLGLALVCLATAFSSKS